MARPEDFVVSFSAYESVKSVRLGCAERRIDTDDLRVGLPIGQAGIYDASTTVDRAYENHFHSHYGVAQPSEQPQAEKLDDRPRGAAKLNDRTERAKPEQVTS